MPIWPFRRSRRQAEAERLLERVVAVSRNPAFFGAGRAPDSLEGRFELMTVHAALALLRLRAPDAPPGLAQAFTDMLFRHFDAGLREAGVGDLAVPKRMHRMAGDFYGRLAAYAEALEAEDDKALTGALARNVFGAAEAPFAAPLALQIRSIWREHGRAPAPALLTPEGWPDPPPGFGI